MVRRIGRPRLAPGSKRVNSSVSLSPTTWKWINATGDAHGVGRSQIIDDALKVYQGEMENVLKHLREELASQEENVKVLIALGKQKDEELQRLKASQQMVGSILSPHGGPSNELSKEAREKARTLRAIVNNPNNVFQVHRLLEGKDKQPETPILGDAFRAWGSWGAIMEAVKAAEAAKGVA